MYHESGYGDTAGQVLTKAAKYVNTCHCNPRCKNSIWYVTSTTVLGADYCVPVSVAHRLVDQVNPRKAAGYFIATAELHAIEEKYRDSANALKNAVNMYARARE